MKISFKKLETTDDNIKVSFDNKSTFESYDKNIALDSGISIPDKCTDFSNITVKTNKSEISDLIYELSTDSVSTGNLSGKLDSRIKKIKIPDNITTISDFAFYENNSLTSVYLSNSVILIGEDAFAECSNLTTINIPNSVTSINSSAFNCCEKLISIAIPNSVTSIGDSAFRHCGCLTSVTIPNSITSISNALFAYCTSLTHMEIPNSVTSIGENAFYYCSSLTSIEIPESVTTIEVRAFAECHELAVINYRGTEEQWNNITKQEYWNYQCPSDMVINYNYIE